MQILYQDIMVVDIDTAKRDQEAIVLLGKLISLQQVHMRFLRDGLVKAIEHQMQHTEFTMQAPQQW